jgi:hypothetical protein
MSLEQRLFALIPHDKALYTLLGVVVFIPLHAISGWVAGLVVACWVAL